MDKKIKKDLVIIAVMLGFIVFAVVKWEIPYFNSLSSSSQSSNNQTKADNSFVSQVNNINNNSTTESVRQDNATDILPFILHIPNYSCINNQNSPLP